MVDMQVVLGMDSSSEVDIQEEKERFGSVSSQWVIMVIQILLNI